MIKNCKNPWCNKEFVPTSSYQKYCSKECAAFIHERQKHNRKIPETIIQVKCEYCGKEHDGRCGSGRFCSKQCATKYTAEKRRGIKYPKVKAHLDKLRVEGKISNKAPYGTWKCFICNEIFETQAKLNDHRIKVHGKLNATCVNEKFVCPYCNKEFETGRSLGGHIIHCANHPNKVQYDLALKRAGKTRSNKLKSGELVNWWKGKHHTDIAKQHMREAACRYLQKNIIPAPCRYNKSSIKVLEQIAKEHGWNIQHAENGGEFYTGIGYFVDAYDKKKNVVLEYDEPKHYEDVENNILREKDLKRQKEIIEHLHCEYWRYNEKMKVLWKVC